MAIGYAMLARRSIVRVTSVLLRCAGGRSAFRLRIAPDDCVGVPTVILPCRAMTVLRWLLLHFCDVAAAVACAGGWVLRELFAGFPVAVGGMKGARPARVPCAISFTLLVETPARAVGVRELCRWVYAAQGVA